MRYRFRQWIKHLFCRHIWHREGTLPVSRVYVFVDGVAFFKPDHWRLWCPKCNAIRRIPYVEQK